MNTVDALRELGKALCGNDFELAPNMTDAEAIQAIARNYTGGGGSIGLLDYPVINMTYKDDGAGHITDFSVDKTWDELNYMSGSRVILHGYGTYIEDGVEHKFDNYDIANIGIWGTSGRLYFYMPPIVDHSTTGYVLNLSYISVSEGSGGTVEYYNRGYSSEEL